MGTMTSDVLGLCHTRPLSRAERSRARQIARRWKMWEPLLLHELRLAHAEWIAELPRLRQRHTAIMSRLLDTGIKMARIDRERTVKLDDPRLTDEEVASEMARGKGRRKKVSHAQQS